MISSNAKSRSKRYSIYHRNSVYWSIMLSSYSYFIFTLFFIPTVHNLIAGYQSIFFDYVKINLVLNLVVIIISSFVGHLLGIQIESPQYEDFLEIEEDESHSIFEILNF